MPHHRARFTSLGRWNVARYVIEDGLTFARAATRAGVSPSTVWGWVHRWQAATPEDQMSLACLEERPSRPHSSPAPVGELEAAVICALRERPDGRHAGSLTNPLFTVRTPQSTRSSAVAAAHAARGPRCRR
jgi:transposase-like protein